VAFSPNNKLVASTDSDGVRIWDISTGTDVSRFKEKIRAQRVAFSADGKSLLVVYGSLAVLQCWSVVTGQLVWQHQAQESILNGTPTFSPNGQLLALADNFSKCGVWNVQSGKRLFWTDAGEWVTVLALSPDGKTLATGGWNQAVRLWDLTTGKELRRLQIHDKRCYALQFSPDGKTLACSTAELYLHFWEVATGKEILGISDLGGRLAFSPDGKTLVTGVEGNLQLLDAATGKLIRRFERICSPGSGDLAISADGKVLASGLDSNFLGLWEVATGKLLHPTLAQQGHQSGVVSLAFSPDGQSLASGGAPYDATLHIWDLGTAKSKHRFTTPRQSVACVAYAPDGKVLAAGGGTPHLGKTTDRDVRLYDPATGKLRRRFTAHPHQIATLSFSPDSKTLATSGYRDHLIKLWDVSTAKELRRLALFKPGDWVSTVSFSPNGKFLAAGAWQGEPIFWPLDPKGKPSYLEYEQPRACRFLAFATDGKTLVTAEIGKSQVVRVWDVNDGGQLKLRHKHLFWLEKTPKVVLDPKAVLPVTLLKHPFTEAAVSPDAKMLATASKEVIQVWDLSSGKELCRLFGHTADISSLAFSPDGKRLASGSWDTTVLLWDVPLARRNGLWLQLSGEEGVAKEAIKEFLAMPKQIVPYLQERLEQLAAVEKEVRRLAKALGADQFKVREKAARDLEAMSSAAEFALCQLLKEQPPLDVRKRLEIILKRLATAIETSNPLPKEPAPIPEDAAGTADGRRILRAFVILEQIGTAEARKVVTALTEHKASVWIAQQAKASLKRFTK
jgi:WD40 repeat protein